jgi:hypothetical protein
MRKVWVGVSFVQGSDGVHSSVSRVFATEAVALAWKGDSEWREVEEHEVEEDAA